ncbi:hypothetical protein [Campylobacter helveticus]|uniref:hypothetical protein n=1 Tax=Campylobacter helveticus TaxID=28898 RepID=UPI0022EABECA|nr:hypothetical protein [Campylobacter helveticus]
MNITVRAKKFTKKHIVFASLFTLILINIAILFVSDNNLFNKSLIGLIVTTCVLYYVLMWINTLKSLKEESLKINGKSFIISIIMDIIKSPKNELGYLFGYFKNKRLQANDDTPSFDYILKNATWIGNNMVTKIGNTTWVGNNMVTKIGNTTWVGNNMVTKIGNTTWVGNNMVVF